jgi:meiotic recombination protein REC8, fungi type
MASQRFGMLPRTLSRSSPAADTGLSHRLVATLGVQTSNRKVNRKSIENVNVPQACDTIQKPPGAPLALRVQGNLLYGVSGVHLKKHKYLLDDAEKVWDHMKSFLRSLQHSSSNELDPKAGKIK